MSNAKIAGACATLAEVMNETGREGLLVKIKGAGGRRMLVLAVAADELRIERLLATLRPEVDLESLGTVALEGWTDGLR